MTTLSRIFASEIMKKILNYMDTNLGAELPKLLAVNAISEPGGVIISYDETGEPISLEFLNASQRELINPQDTNFKIYR
jgi:hypothetical protein